MKIKSNLYCITDKNNKPDFRYLFQNPADAKKKIKQIKNETKGETLFVSKTKRDFFVDGVKKGFVDPYKKMSIKRGCWTSLNVKKVSLLDTIEPEQFFKKVEKAEEQTYAYAKEYETQSTFAAKKLSLPSIPNPLLGLNLEGSFLKTKAFAGAVSMLIVITVISVFGINYHTSNQIAKQALETQAKSAEKILALQKQVQVAKASQNADQFDQDLNKFVLDTMQSFAQLKTDEFESEVRRIVAGSPMERMVPYIVQQERTVAAFLVGIAKKESNLGRRVPVLNGQDCYNYWGYRGIRPKMGSGGHTCFDSPEDAINTVAGRIQDLVQADVNTPQEMVLWKCGSACAQDPAANKWITDVNLYFSKLKENEKPTEKPNS